mgnify:CR=1 FL=1
MKKSLFFVTKFGEQQFPFPPISRKDYLDLQLKSNAIFLDIAFGSLMETDCQLEIAKDLNYISSDEYDFMYKKIHTLAKIITGLKSRRLSNSVASNTH